MFEEIVSYNIAKLLNNTLYSEHSDKKYAAEDVEVTYDNYLGKETYGEGELIENGDCVHGKYYMACTYGELYDYLHKEYGIIISFTPAFTYATNNNLAFYFTAYKTNKESHSFDIFFEDKSYMYSFHLMFETILKKILENG